MTTRRSHLMTMSKRGLAVIALAATTLIGVMGQPSAAHPHSSALHSTKTATGSYRPGLTTAGLATLSALAPTHLWLGLNKAADASAGFDVQTTMLNDGKPLAAGFAHCVSGLRAGASHAAEVTVRWGRVSKTTLKPGDVLSLAVSARAGTGSKCNAATPSSRLRVYYGGRKVPSQVGVTIAPDASRNVYLNSKSTVTSCAAVKLSLAQTKPVTHTARCQQSAALGVRGSNKWRSVGTWHLAAQCACSNRLIPEVRNNPPAPAPEPITVTELPLPPTAPTSGTCSNPTGCIAATGAMQSGSYLPDGNEVTADVTFAGAPAAPDPASIYSGTQLIIVKTDGTMFPNGEAWKCITCGIPAGNETGMNGATDYPQTFADGKRVLWGQNIVACDELLASAACTPALTHVYPVIWSGAVAPFGIRELRLNPDNVHIGFNEAGLSAGTYSQYGYFGRLDFDVADSRYNIDQVTRLFDPSPTKQTIYVDPHHKHRLKLNTSAIAVGELRGFTKDGKQVVYIGNPSESSNIDVFAANLTTGKVRRLTSNPEYTDPVDSSPDNDWLVAMDTRGSDRQEFVAAMRGIPPLTDLVTTSAVSSIRNNGNRRFFQPILIDRYGDRGSYQGQQVNACPDPADISKPGSICDPNWNGMADPRWSPDGTSVVYWQALAVSPACGGDNPLGCETSTEPGGRQYRMMIAHFTSRKPVSIPMPAATLSDTVPWGTPVTSADPTPARPVPPTGTYTLKGKAFGSARVSVTDRNVNSEVAVGSIAVKYTNYSDDGTYVLNGSERAVNATDPGKVLTTKVDWYSHLVQTGCATGTKTTGPGGFHLTIGLLTNIFDATGTMTTTINGRTYTQPANGT